MRPAVLDRVVKNCLAKDPADRYQSAHDLKLQLQWILESGSQASGIALPAADKRRNRSIAGWITATVLLIALIALFFFRPPAASNPLLIEADINPPAGKNFTFGGDSGFPLCRLSHDIEHNLVQSVQCNDRDHGLRTRSKRKDL